jgi:hypothetical protein
VSALAIDRFDKYRPTFLEFTRFSIDNGRWRYQDSRLKGVNVVVKWWWLGQRFLSAHLGQTPSQTNSIDTHGNRLHNIPFTARWIIRELKLFIFIVPYKIAWSFTSTPSRFRVGWFLDMWITLHSEIINLSLRALVLGKAKTSRMYRQLAHDGDRVISPTCRPPLPPQKIFPVLLSVRCWVEPRAIVRPERLRYWSHRYSNPRPSGLNLLHHRITIGKDKGKGKAIPLQALTGPEGSRRLSLSGFVTIDT